jgi:hypothetical protein
MTPIQAIAVRIAECAAAEQVAVSSIEDAKQSGRNIKIFEADRGSWRSAMFMLEEAAAGMRAESARDALIIALILSRRAETDDVGTTDRALHQRLIEALQDLSGTDAAGLGLVGHAPVGERAPETEDAPIVARPYRTGVDTPIEVIRKEIVDTNRWGKDSINEDMPVAARSALEGVACQLVPTTLRDVQVLASILAERVASDHSDPATRNRDTCALALRVVEGLASLTGATSGELGLQGYVTPLQSAVQFLDKPAFGYAHTH